MRPLEPLALLEHQRVRLTLEDQPEPQPAKTSVNPSVQTKDRREEFLWLANESGPYTGQWVALDGGRLIAHGPELATVRVEAQAAGVSRPLLTVKIDVRGIVNHSLVYFFAEPSIRKNVLGRAGWLDRVRLGLIDYDRALYLAEYDQHRD